MFQEVWADLESFYGREGLRFPREIFWLNGAPGAGKGTHTHFMMRERGFKSGPIVMSDLLQSPEAKRCKDAGCLVGDREVIGFVFRALLEPQYTDGVVFDGFPRSAPQVECLRLLFKKMKELHNEHAGMADASAFPSPNFHIWVLDIGASESVKRQLFRGKQVQAWNEAVNKTGVGELRELRKTDIEESAARTRYDIFKTTTCESLLSLQSDARFCYHWVDAHGSIEQVQARIREAMGK
jgi:adenylate kinase